MRNMSKLPQQSNVPTVYRYLTSDGLDLNSLALSRLIEQAVACAFDIPRRELRAPTRRCASVAFARQVAMYLAHVVCGYSLTQVGLLFQRDRTTAAYACRKIEDGRDDPAFDFCLECLESAVRVWAFHQKLELATQ